MHQVIGSSSADLEVDTYLSTSTTDQGLRSIQVHLGTRQNPHSPDSLVIELPTTETTTEPAAACNLAAIPPDGNLRDNIIRPGTHKRRYLPAITYW